MADREFKLPERSLSTIQPGLGAQAGPLGKKLNSSLKQYGSKIAGGARIIVGKDSRGPVTARELGTTIKNVLVGEGFEKGQTGGALGLVQQGIQTPGRLLGQSFLTYKQALTGEDESLTDLGPKMRALTGAQDGEINSFQKVIREGRETVAGLGGTATEQNIVPPLLLGGATITEFMFGGKNKPLKKFLDDLAADAVESSVKSKLIKQYPHLKTDESLADALARVVSRSKNPNEIESIVDTAVSRATRDARYNPNQVRRIEQEIDSRLPIKAAPDETRIYFTRTAPGESGQYVATSRAVAERFRDDGRPIITADVPTRELIESDPTKTAGGVFRISNDLADEAELERIVVEQELLRDPEFEKLPFINVPEPGAPTPLQGLGGLRAVDENISGADVLGAPIARELGPSNNVGRGPLPGIIPSTQQGPLEIDFNNLSPTQTTALRAGTQVRPAIGQEAYRLTGELLTPISSRLRRINQKLEDRLRQHEYVVAQKVTQQSQAVLPFLRGARKMNPEDYKVLDLALKNGDEAQIEAIVSKYGLQKDIAAVRDVLDDIYKRAKNVGMDVAYRKNYFPRTVKNPAAFMAFLRDDPNWGSIQQQAKEEARKQGVAYSDIINDHETMAGIVNNFLRGYGDRLSLGASGNTKNRTIETLTEELNQFYEPFETSMTRYITTMNDEIEGRYFFGKRLDTDPEKLNTRDSIGNYVMDLVAKGDITPFQQDEVASILQSRFNKGKMNGALSLYRDLEYISTMGNPISAITQLSDMAWSLYDNGWWNTLKGAGASITGKGLTREDIGLDRIIAEFDDKTFTAKAVEKVFKVVGLENIDRLGKETFINARVRKLQQLAKKNDPELTAQVNRIFEEEAPKVLADLAARKYTDSTRFLLFNRLLDFQPVAKSEVPQVYLNHPNGRIFYMLKTFTIKQFDIYRREAIDGIVAGAQAGDAKMVSKNMKNLMYLAAMFVVANATADEIKDTILGRETNINDRTWDNIFRLFGATKYDIYKARQDGIGSQVIRKILFPASLTDRAYQDVTNWIEGKKYEKGPNKGDSYKLESTQSIPGVGKLWYWWFGRGAQKQEQKAGGTSEDGVFELPAVQISSLEFEI